MVSHVLYPVHYKPVKNEKLEDTEESKTSPVRELSSTDSAKS
jgi:hypothetical protein